MCVETIVDIIIATRNSQGRLLNTLRLLQQQTHQAFHAIIVDDGSTDATIAEARAYTGADPRFEFVSLHESGGVAHARNVGLTRVVGDYVSFLDDDDTFVPEYLEVLLGTLRSSDADIAVAGAEIEFADGSIIPIGLNSRFEVFSAVRALEYLYDGYLTGHLWNKMFSATVLSEFRFPLQRSLSDLSGVARLLANKPSLVATPQVVYTYAPRGGSILQSSEPDFLDPLRAVEMVRRTAELLDPADRLRGKREMFEVRFGYLYALQLLARRYRQVPELKEMRSAVRHWVTSNHFRCGSPTLTINAIGVGFLWPVYRRLYVLYLRRTYAGHRLAR